MRNIARVAAAASLVFSSAPIARGQDVVVGWFTGKSQGPLCGGSSSNPDTLEAFEETTTQSMTASGNVSGVTRSTYRVQLSTLCVAPFFKAVANREELTANLKYVDSKTHGIVMTLSMPSAYLDTVLLAANPDSGDLPTVSLGLVAGNVVWGGPPSGTPGYVAMSAAITAHRAPTILQVRGTGHKTSDAVSAREWARLGLTGTEVGISETSPAISFSIKSFHLVCAHPVDAATGLPSGGNQIAVGELQKPVDANTVAIHNLVTGHNVVPASFKIVNKSGVSGVVVSVKHLLISVDNVNSSQETITPTVKIDANGHIPIEIHDLVSGNTAGGC